MVYKRCCVIWSSYRIMYNAYISYYSATTTHVTVRVLCT